MAAKQDIRQALGARLRIAADGVVLAVAPRGRGGAACIVQLGAIGDFVLWLEAGRRLARHYRESGTRLVLVANAGWAHWARELQLADEVWAIEPARFDRDLRHRAGWVRRMRAAGFVEVVQPTHSRTAMWGDSLVRASGAARRVGSAGDCANTPAWLKRRADRWFTRLIDCGDDKRMELLRHADFLRGLGIADFRAAPPVLTAGAAPAHLPARYAVLVPGAGWEGRAWPAASFAEIGRRLAARGLDIVLAGGAGDRAAAQAVREALPGRVHDRVGATGLAELAALLAHAQVVLANESGPAHIAAAAGAPVVCILGGGHFGRFLPYALEAEARTNAPRRSAPVAVAQRMDCFGCNWNCIYPRAPGEAVKCVKDVTPEAVWRQVAAVLERAQSDV